MSILSLFSPFFLWILSLRQLAGLMLAIAAVYLCRREEKEKAAGQGNGPRPFGGAVQKKEKIV